MKMMYSIIALFFVCYSFQSAPIEIYIGYELGGMSFRASPNQYASRYSSALVVSRIRRDFVHLALLPQSSISASFGSKRLIRLVLKQFGFSSIAFFATAQLLKIWLFFWFQYIKDLGMLYFSYQW